MLFTVAGSAGRNCRPADHPSGGFRPALGLGGDLGRPAADGVFRAVWQPGGWCQTAHGGCRSGAGGGGGGGRGPLKENMGKVAVIILEVDIV